MFAVKDENVTSQLFCLESMKSLKERCYIHNSHQLPISSFLHENRIGGKNKGENEVGGQIWRKRSERKMYKRKERR